MGTRIDPSREKRELARSASATLFARSHSAPLIRALAFLILLTISSSCGAMHEVGLWRAPGIGSFHNVSFGDTFHDAELLYPGAARETSPYGAHSLRVDNIINEGIPYRTAVYEFAYKSGMQLVMAEFDPSRASAIHEWVDQQLGPPSRSGGPDSATSKISLWATPQGESVILNPQSHWLAIIGPEGQQLRSDIEPRELNAESAL